MSQFAKFTMAVVLGIGAATLWPGLNAQAEEEEGSCARCSEPSGAYCVGAASGANACKFEDGKCTLTGGGCGISGG